MGEIAIEIKNITKTYTSHSDEIEIFKNYNYIFKYGKLYGIVGRSGCGKSTLLKLIGLIENVTHGDILIDFKSTNKLNDEEASLIRNKKIGFVFQDYLLDDNLNVLDNVLLPTYAHNNKNNNRKNIDLAKSLLNKYALNGRIKYYPSELSGGERQRVALCRALINNPGIILADEPTGNLDKKNELKIIQDLKKLSEDNKCVIVISHSSIINEYADEIINLEEA